MIWLIVAQFSRGIFNEVQWKLNKSNYVIFPRLVFQSWDKGICSCLFLQNIAGLGRLNKPLLHVTLALLCGPTIRFTYSICYILWRRLVTTSFSWQRVVLSFHPRPWAELSPVCDYQWAEDNREWWHDITCPGPGTLCWSRLLWWFVKISPITNVSKSQFCWGIIFCKITMCSEAAWVGIIAPMKRRKGMCLFLQLTNTYFLSIVSDRNCEWVVDQ